MVFLEVPRNFIIENIRAILEKNMGYNFLAKFLVNRILAPRGLKLGEVVLEAQFGNIKDPKWTEIALGRRIF